MVSDVPPAESPGPDDTPARLESDGGTAPGFDEARLYTVVRAAVKDALLDVIGTLLLLGVAFVLVVAGVGGLFRASAPAQAVVGAVVLAIGVYLAAATLELVPPVREWL